jgi:hypothetical protein
MGMVGAIGVLSAQAPANPPAGRGAGRGAGQQTGAPAQGGGRGDGGFTSRPAEPAVMLFHEDWVSDMFQPMVQASLRALARQAAGAVAGHTDDLSGPQW